MTMTTDGTVVLDVRVSDDGGVRVVRVLGDLDVNSVNRFDRIMEDLLAGHPTTIVIDLSQVGFIDSCGLRSLITTRARVATREALMLRAPRPATVRLLELTGLSAEFFIEGAPGG